MPLVWLKLPALEIRLANTAICPGMVAQLIKKQVPEGGNLQADRVRLRPNHVAMSNPAALLPARAHPVKGKAALRTEELPVGREPARRARDRGPKAGGHPGNLAAVATNLVNGPRAATGHKILEVRLNHRSRCFPRNAGKHRFATIGHGFSIDCIRETGFPDRFVAFFTSLGKAV
ncbi:hypothetical protein SAMN05216332_101446 [Nitrosospira briensis]|nr:hypothetical protein SAMN05216332_101446 [Nitrosospira briensis]